MPFEANLGRTCSASSFAVVMRYWGRDVGVRDALKVVGYPPFRGYAHPELVWWVKRHHGLRMLYLPHSDLERIRIYVNEGYPVIVHQTLSSYSDAGHNRVVVGYSDSRRVVILSLRAGPEAACRRSRLNRRGTAGACTLGSWRPAARTFAPFWTLRSRLRNDAVGKPCADPTGPNPAAGSTVVARVRLGKPGDREGETLYGSPSHAACPVSPRV